MGSFGVNCVTLKAGHFEGDFDYCAFWLNIFYLVNAARVTPYNWENSKPLTSEDAIKKAVTE